MTGWAMAFDVSSVDDGIYNGCPRHCRVPIHGALCTDHCPLRPEGALPYSPPDSKAIQRAIDANKRAARRK